MSGFHPVGGGSGEAKPLSFDCSQGEPLAQTFPEKRHKDMLQHPLIIGIP